MATVIKTHNSTVSSNEPTNLELGELAVNVTDQKLWVGDGSATPVILVDPADSGTPAASEVTYDPVDSGLTATDVQAAVDEVVGTRLSGLTIEVYASGAVPTPPRDPAVLYVELV